MSEFQSIANGFGLISLGIIGFLVKALISDFKKMNSDISLKIDDLEKQKMDKTDFKEYIALIISPLNIANEEQKKQLKEIADLLNKQKEHFDYRITELQMYKRKSLT